MKEPTQAGIPDGEKQFVSWLHLAQARIPYHEDCSEGVHTSWISDEEKQFVSWLHFISLEFLITRTVLRGPHKLDPDQMEGSNSCLGCI